MGEMDDMSKTALITGASAGIGLELSKVFAKNGFNVILVSRNSQKLEEIAEELKKRYHIKAGVISKDLRKPGAPQELYDEIKAGGTDIDVLVNNAGIGINGSFAEFNPKKIIDVIQVNITSLTMLCRLFSKDMVKKGYGRILNVSSTASFQASPLMSTYYASKAYVQMFSEAINYELKKNGITVTALCPGPTRTEFFERNDMKETNIAKGSWLMKPADVAEAGFAGLMRGKMIVIPGLINKFLAFSVRFTPRKVSAAVIHYLNNKEPVRT
jgi:short-subunit dehydrogenase